MNKVTMRTRSYKIFSRGLSSEDWYGLPGVDVTPLMEKLESYNACPSLTGMTWAQINWHNPQVVADKITTLTKEQKLKLGKGKALVCAVLGAALSAAQKEKHFRQRAEGEVIKSLQDLVKTLQGQLENETRILSDQLAAERVTNQRLHTTLQEALEWEKLLREQLDENKFWSRAQRSEAGSDEERELHQVYSFEELKWERKRYL